MSKVQCSYKNTCEESPNCGAAKKHDSSYCELCPRHQTEIVCLPVIKMSYKGEYPPPRFEHNEEIPGYGIVRSRTRTYSGWEYSIYNNLFN